MGFPLGWHVFSQFVFPRLLLLSQIRLPNTHRQNRIADTQEIEKGIENQRARESEREGEKQAARESEERGRTSEGKGEIPLETMALNGLAPK